MTRWLSALTVVLCLVLSAALLGDSNGANTEKSPNDYTAKEIHEWLAKNELPGKIRGMIAQESLLASKAVTNWQEYDMSFYSIDLTIDHVAEVIYGSVDEYGSVTVTDLDSVVINLLDAMVVDSVYNATGNLAFTHTSDHLTINLDKTYVQDEEFNFTVVCHGTPSGSSSFLGFSFDTHDGLPLISTLSEPYGARSWWPCNDITVDKVDSVDIIATVDTSLVVSSNGLQESDTDNGDGTHTVYWKERYPITTYLVSLAIHPYATWGDWYHYSPTDSMPLGFFVYPDEDANSRPYFGVLDEMIGFEAQRFGEYPFINEKYGCTHFDWGGAMEHQTNTSTTSSSFGYTPEVISHELGHQWWGDMVTCADWHHIWINEGFATYAEALYHELKYDDYHSYMNGFEYTGGGSIYIDDTTDVWNIFGSIVYDKGGWVLHMLRHVVGDSLFFESLANYREQYKWQTASTEDFQAAVEATSGMDLDYFFQQWIYGTYRPVYRLSYLTEPAAGGGYDTYVHIRQSQLSDPQVFTMPIDLFMEQGAAGDTVTVFNSKRDENFIIHTDAAVTDIKLDPMRWISRLVYDENYTMHIVSTDLDDGEMLTPYTDTVDIRGGYGNTTFTIQDGSLPNGLNLGVTSGEISGTPTQHGDFTFTVLAVDNLDNNWRDSVEYTITLAEVPDFPGDANTDGSVNIGDAVFIIEYIFNGGAAPLVMNWADVNADCSVNIGDAVYLINYIFGGGPTPQSGCVE